VNVMMKTMSAMNNIWLMYTLKYSGIPDFEYASFS